MNSRETHDPPGTTISRQCIAESKRSGVRCRKSAMKERTVCLAHGGRTPRGVASPHLKHGRHSKLLHFRAPPTGKSRISDVPSDRVCGAKTRAGTPCKNWGQRGTGRCRMHGGKSFYSIASPSFKHGWYSRYQPWVSLRRQEEERVRRDRWVAARMEEIRAQRAEQEARKQAQRDKERINWAEVGPTIMSAYVGLTDEHEAPSEPDETAESSMEDSLSNQDRDSPLRVAR